MIPKRLATTECRKKERERGRKKGRREEREGAREGGSEGGSEGEERKRRRREEGRIARKARALLASVVHVARALYMNVTQDVAVGLSCILCTTTLDYTEYHARLRSIIQNTMHESARLY